jgi:multiple sugar transport system substrate-binding protein
MQLLLGVMSVCSLDVEGMQVAADGPPGQSARSASPSPQAVSPHPPPKLTVWTHEHVNSPEFEALRESAARFNVSQRHYRVELQSSLYRKYDAWLLSAALTGTLPCLFEFDGPYLRELAWAGYLKPLDRFVSPALLNDLLQSIVTEGTYDGHLYSLGQYESGLALWGNRRHLAKAGVRIPTLQAPWSLGEFERVLSKLAVLPGVEHAIDLGVDSASPEFYTYAYAPVLQGFGGDLIDRRPGGMARQTLDGHESVLALDHLQRWFRRGWAGTGLLRTDSFISEKAALAWNGNWAYAEYRRALGKDLVLLPLPDLGHGIKTGVGSWVWGISSTCSNPAAAWAFMQFLLTPSEIRRMTNVNGTMPARRLVVEHSKVYGPDGPLRLFVEQLDQGLAVPRPATPAYGTMTISFSQAVAAIIRGDDVQTQLTRAADRIDRDIARRQGYAHP